jgi:hypothetical protein
MTFLNSQNKGKNMNFFKSIFNHFYEAFSVNPANGLPMIHNSGIDVAGNPFGTDSSHHTTDHSHSWGGGHDFSSSNDWGSGGGFGGGSSWD